MPNLPYIGIKAHKGTFIRPFTIKAYTDKSTLIYVCVHYIYRNCTNSVFLCKKLVS